MLEMLLVIIVNQHSEKIAHRHKNLRTIFVYYMEAFCRLLIIANDLPVPIATASRGEEAR